MGFRRKKLIEYAEPLLQKLINKINNEIKPDLVLYLGDLIEDFNDHDKDIANFRYIWNKLKKINGRFYSCLGNHDLRSMSSTREMENIMEYKHMTFSFDINGLHIIILGIDVDSHKETGFLKQTLSL